MRRIALAIVLLAGCSRGEGGVDGGARVAVGDGKVLQAAENESTDGAAPAHATAKPLAAHEQVDVPSGGFVAGSTPGDKGRDPTLEPALLDIELGGFSIDRYLYPNDPKKPPLTGVTRAKASELCEQAGARLCTELEWERACKGTGGDAYAGASAWDPACAKDLTACASGFGTLGMGAIREWTASDVAPSDKDKPKAGAVRGARADASAVDHRCAHLAAVDPTITSDDLSFRCCRGAPNAATIPTPSWDQTYRRADVSAAQVGQMLASVPELAALAKEVTFFKEPEDTSAVLARGDAGAPPPNTTLTTSPLLWNPVPGEEVLVVAGRSGKDAFVVAFYRLPKERFRIASSFVMKDERGPVVLGFNGYVRRRLFWATCWDCPAESGNVTYREDNRVVITQK